MRGEFGGPPAVSVPGTAMMARTKMARSTMVRLTIVRSLKMLRGYRMEEGTVLAPRPRSAHLAEERVVS
jgi:hypothetical protein